MEHELCLPMKWRPRNKKQTIILFLFIFLGFDSSAVFSSACGHLECEDGKLI
jgi:hypothetical protein